MNILVTNCYDWTGFHIVNKLLESGYIVDGYDTLSRQDNHLSMFLGRNSNFTFVQDIESKKYHAVIILGNKSPIHNLKSERIIKITHQVGDCNNSQNTVKIKKPMLFGEWMLMNEKEFYYNSRYVSFLSDEFKSRAIHIDDFTKFLLQCLKAAQLPAIINIYSKRDKGYYEKTLDNNVFIHDNTPIEKKMNNLLTHYKRNKHFY